MDFVVIVNANSLLECMIKYVTRNNIQLLEANLTFAENTAPCSVFSDLAAIILTKLLPFCNTN